MKIVFCGPPHSGKSVFIANLIDKLPTDAYTIIRACPDGEGTWSNNKNQQETSIVRKKGKFTKEFIENACNAIDNQTNKIVLVDVGGVMSKENEKVFKHCDSFVVLSSDKEKKSEWLKFGEKNGLNCIGCIDSSLEGNEEIYSREPYFQGKITGLERGEILENSSVIKALASDIVEKSKYTEKEPKEDKKISGVYIDDTELGFELGYGKEIETENGITIKKVRWAENAIPKIHKAIQEKVKEKDDVRINGVRANFALCTMAKTVKDKGVKNISTYDIRSKQYIPIKELKTKRGIKQTEGLAFNIIENKNNAFIDIDINKEQYTLEDYEKCEILQIKKTKNLYLSGRMPLWLLASISSSYNVESVFTFQPGKGFTCISSNKEKDLEEAILILPKELSIKREILNEYCKNVNLQLNSKYEVSSSSIMKNIVLNDIGIGFTNTENIKEIADKITIIKKIDNMPSEYGIATLKKNMCNKATIELTEKIKQYYKQN